MSIVCVGFNHQSAPIEVLEKISLSPERTNAALRELAPGGTIQEAAALSTCNRTEFYLVTADEAAARRAVMEYMAAHSRLGGDVAGYSYTHANERAARHLFRVAAGIDSMIVGESEILGQIRRAYELAVEAGCVGGMLNTLMLRALGFGRRVRTETAIGKGNLSVASVSVKLAQQVFPDLSEKNLLVLGAGQTAQLAARHFLAVGVGRFMVCNRTEANAAAILREGQGEFFTVDRMQSAVEACDVLVCAVGAPHIIITREGVDRIMHERGGRPLVLIDLSMPRNVDIACGEIDGVHVYTIDNIEAIAGENRQQRQAEIALVEELIDRETRNFTRMIQSADTGRLITMIRRRVEETRQAHIERHGRNWSESERAQYDRFSDSLLRSVLHDLTTNMRAIDPDTEQGAREFDIVRRLFQLPTPNAEE